MIIGRQFLGLSKGPSSPTHQSTHWTAATLYTGSWVFPIFDTLMNVYFLSNHHLISPLWWAERYLCFSWLHICMASSSWFLIEGQNVPLLLDCQHVVNAKLLIIIPAHNQAHTKQMGTYSHLLHSSLGAFSVIFPSSRTAAHITFCVQTIDWPLDAWAQDLQMSCFT